MQKKSLILILSLIVFLGYIALALGNAGDDTAETTLILVRHAEKAADGTLNPPLTDLGAARAAELAYLLGHVKLDAVYSTPFQRTEDTVLPTARGKGLEVQPYRADQEDFLDNVLKKYRGGTVLICGHSNTVPILANELLGREEYEQLDDAVYDNLFIVTVPASGPARVLRIRFDTRTPSDLTHPFLP
ncbi:MAG: phosphoglycerate mutase family protein [Candidatus Aminicenantaceae bacterium]